MSPENWGSYYIRCSMIVIRLTWKANYIQLNRDYHQCSCDILAHMVNICRDNRNYLLFRSFPKWLKTRLYLVDDAWLMFRLIYSILRLLCMFIYYQDFKVYIQFCICLDIMSFFQNIISLTWHFRDFLTEEKHNFIDITCVWLMYHTYTQISIVLFTFNERAIERSICSWIKSFSTHASIPSSFPSFSCIK